MRFLVPLLPAPVVGRPQESDEFGQRLVRDTKDCCWPGQTWSTEVAACVGAPACPEGFDSRGETCVRLCNFGQIVDEDTKGHCCWQAQVWSRELATCIGTPVCPP